MKLVPMDAAASPQQRALAMDEILLAIYGFALGDDLNSILEDTAISCVSSRFSRCFVPYLSSVPLRLTYDGTFDGTFDAPGEGRILEWLKENQIASLSQLEISIEGIYICRCIDDFDGADVSNLKSLGLRVSWRNAGDTRDVEGLLDLFTRANFLTDLDLRLFFSAPADVYQNFLSHFTNLKSLDVKIWWSGDVNIPDMGARLPPLETLVLRGGGISLRGFSFRSESLKTLDLSDYGAHFNAINHIDCPSLTSLRITNKVSRPITIAGVTGPSLVEQFGNFKRDFITNYFKTNEHQLRYSHDDSDAESITSISIVPSSFIRSNAFRVRDGCLIVLYTLGV